MSLRLAAVANRDIDSTLRENRVFPPPAGVQRQGPYQSLEEYEALYKQSIEDPEEFWAGVARNCTGSSPGTRFWSGICPGPNGSWAARLNLSYNCVDRHALGAARDKTALIWEGEPGEIRRLTYAELHAEVQRFANALKSLGIQKGDRVAVYMGMTPELAIALLACARIGAVHSVIFGGFAANAIADRVNDSGCVAILTQDTSYRRGNEIQLKRTVDEAMPACPTVKHVVVYRRTGSPVEHGCRPRPLVARPRRQGRARLPRRAHGFRGPALHPLHLRHRPASPRACSTPPAATPCKPTSPRNTSSTCATTTSTGARPTSAGSPATPMSSMARCRTAPPS